MVAVLAKMGFWDRWEWRGCMRAGCYVSSGRLGEEGGGFSIQMDSLLLLV